MTTVLDITIIFVLGAISLAFALFCIAWVTVLPTIGLLYWFGYLS